MESEIDVSVRCQARVWDHWLGGIHNFAVDRAAGNRLATEYPGVLERVRSTRHFLIRTVDYLTREAGISQFLDIGSGLPTSGNTHEIAQRTTPSARVVYVDSDPQTARHASWLLARTTGGATACVQADLHQPDEILAVAARTLDLSRPVALVLSGILGHTPTYEQACTIVRELMAALPSGSHLMAHDVSDTSAEWCAIQARYNGSVSLPYHLRSPEQIAGYFDSLDLVAPGVVPLTSWRPDDRFPYTREWTALVADLVGGVGRKP